jgi:Spy/CpxP family protein refolding chaperone
MRRFIALVALAVLATPVAADTTHHLPHGTDTPYAGLETRDIKALSPEQVADLRAGRGMGLALAAELNGYPGPRHVLDLAGDLKLSPKQQRRTADLFTAMQHETSALGERLIEAERALDRLFAEGRATPQSLSAATADAARLEGELRAAHLRYHLAMVDVLTPDQVHLYNRLRGYVHH